MKIRKQETLLDKRVDSIELECQYTNIAVKMNGLRIKEFGL